MADANPLEEVKVFRDRTGAPEWRVEAFFEDGAVEVTIFPDPNAETDAKVYADKQYGQFKVVDFEKRE